MVNNKVKYIISSIILIFILFIITIIYIDKYESYVEIQKRSLLPKNIIFKKEFENEVGMLQLNRFELKDQIKLKNIKKYPLNIGQENEFNVKKWSAINDLEKKFILNKISTYKNRNNLKNTELEVIFDYLIKKINKNPKGYYFSIVNKIVDNDIIDYKYYLNNDIYLYLIDTNDMYLYSICEDDNL